MPPKRTEIQFVDFGSCVAFLLLSSAIMVTSSTQSLNSTQTCRAEVTNLTIPSPNMTFNLAFLASISNLGEDKLVGGAFYYAIDVLEKVAQDKKIPVTFTKSVYDTNNFENAALRVMADLYCARNVSAFIGPKGHCKSAGRMATALDIPYMTYGCQDNHNDTNEHRMINTDPSIAYVSKYITAVLGEFHWSSFWLVTGKSPRWEYTAKQLIQNTELKNITLNGENTHAANDKFNPHYIITNPYAGIFRSSKEQTRVYVYLGVYESLIAFLRQMQEEGLTDTGLYVVVAAPEIDKDSLDDFYLSKLEKKIRNRPSPEEKRKYLKTFRNVLVVGAERYINHIDEFDRNVITRTEDPPFNFPKLPKHLSARSLGAEAYHLYDATIIYGLTVMSLMMTKGADPNNASQVIRHIKGKQHCSKQGQKITIHDNGETEDSYELRAHTIGHDKKDAFGVVGTFDKAKLTGIELKLLLSKDGWPVSEPACGFHGEKCEDESKFPDWVVPLCVVIVVVLCIPLACFHRRYSYEKKLDKVLWKIDTREIDFMNACQIHDISTPKPPKKKESFVGPLSTLLIQDSPDPYQMSDFKSDASDQPLIGKYKGCHVFVKQLTRRHFELNRALKKEFQLRKELTHENINRFIGASIETPTIHIVTQFCSRNSLKDILDNQTLPSEEMFKTSLIQDLINGMTFIHDSLIGYHGNLKSSNCLVDRRWTLKITDFGFSAIGPPPPARGDDERAYEKLLWTAPEFLHRRFTSSCSYISQNNSSSMSHSLRPSRTFSTIQGGNSHGHNNTTNNNNTPQTMQKGDVYSFAFILYELYGQSGPWGITELKSREIIEKLLTPTICEAFRPDTSALKCDTSIVNLMHSCWGEDAESRPDFKYTIRLRFKPKQQGSLVELYADNLEALVVERTEQLRKEKKMTENLLLRMLPRSVADRLMRGQPVQPEQFECVTIYFSDIVGFTKLSAESAPMEVITLLNDLYTLFDSVIHKFLVYKVETIGDAYMVVSGLPNPIGDSHAGEIASMSLLFLQRLIEKRFTVGGQTDYMLKIRIGIHSGPCCAGVVGLKMPRYCLFGDTVNTANRMESTGEALKIHCSAECKAILDKLGGYQVEKRGHTDVKGKGQLLTYFLTGESDQVRQQRLSSMTSHGRCVSSSNLDYSGTPFNRRSAPPFSAIAPLSPKHNGLRSASISSLPHNSSSSFRGPKNITVPASLNTSMDSAISGPFNPNDSIDDTHSISDFRTSTLPRPTSIIRQNSVSGGGCGGKSMSPIAEDPWTPTGLAMNEKGFKFHDNVMCSSDTESERDTLLKQLPMNSFKRSNSLQRQFSSENSTGTPETIL